MLDDDDQEKSIEKMGEEKERNLVSGSARAQVLRRCHAVRGGGWGSGGIGEVVDAMMG